VIVEEEARRPLTVDETQVTISGVVDLVQVTPDRVAIVDYKTDQSRRAVSEYRVQLSVYYHVLESVYPDRSVEASLYFTADDETVPIDALTLEEIGDRASTQIEDK